MKINFKFANVLVGIMLLLSSGSLLVAKARKAGQKELKLRNSTKNTLKWRTYAEVPNHVSKWRITAPGNTGVSRTHGQWDKVEIQQFNTNKERIGSNTGLLKSVVYEGIGQSKQEDWYLNVTQNRIRASRKPVGTSKKELTRNVAADLKSW